MVEGTPPGDTLLPAPQRATLPRKGARCGAGAGSPSPHRPHPGHTGRGAPATRSRGRAAGGGTAPDTRRPSQWWEATPPGTPFRHPHSEQRRPARAYAVGPVLGPHARRGPHPGHTGRGTLAARSRGRVARGETAPDTRRPSQRWQATPPGDSPPPPPRHAAPTGHAGQGDSVGPPHPHTCAHSTWVADPNSLPSGRAVGGGTGPDLRRPSQWWKAPPPGTPFRHPHSEQRRPTVAHAVGPVLGHHARTYRTRDTRVTEPWLPAPEDGWPGEGQRLTPDAPHNGGRSPPPGTAPHHPRGTQPQQGMQAKGTVLGTYSHTPAPTARGWRTPTARPVGGQSGEGQRLTSDAPHNGRRHPPGDTLLPAPQRATPACKGAAVGLVLGPHARTDRTLDTRVAEPRLPAQEDRRPEEGQCLTSDAPHNGGRHPPPGTPFRHPHSEQRRPARAHAVGPLLGPHAHTNRTRDTRVAEPWLPARKDWWPGEGQRLTPDDPHSGGRPPPPGTAPHHPRGTQPPQGMQAKRRVLGPHTHTPAPTARGWRTPTACPVGGQSGEGQRLTSDAPHNGERHPPRQGSSATPTASNAGPQGRTLWGQCWVPPPTPTAPGTHGSRNPGCPLQRTGGRGRDSA